MNLIDDGVDLVWVLEPHSTSLVLDDFIHRATHVDIDDIGLGIFLDKFSCACEAIFVTSKELDRYRIFSFIDMEHVKRLFIVVLDSLVRDHFHHNEPCSQFFGNGPES